MASLEVAELLALNLRKMKSYESMMNPDLHLLLNQERRLLVKLAGFHLMSRGFCESDHY